jgi:hypothetical protein
MTRLPVPLSGLGGIPLFVAGIPQSAKTRNSHTSTLYHPWWGVLHLYIKHTILFCLAKFFSKVGLKPEPVQPFHYHINRHIQYIKSRRLYFTCQGERAATQWLERPWKSRGGVIKRTEPTIKYYKIQSMST